jgi:hypothetical protein
MFRKRDPQGKLYEFGGLLPRDKAERLTKSWADDFRRVVLPLLDGLESLFAPMYCDDNGRPNFPVSILLGVLILKEMFDLTDRDALEELEWNLLWHHALRLTPEEAHLCQKTLHNFRARLLECDGGRLAFEQTTERIIEELGIQTHRQRLDSTHILSNFARLTRLGLFCETNRVFLTELRREHPRLFDRVPERLRQRYLKDDGSPSAYGDARSSDSRRRLAVCARDVYRLHALFAKTAAAKLEAYALLARLLHEQCEIVPAPKKPEDDDDDAGEGKAPVKLKEPKAVKGNSLQTPHDPDVTYSGHKGKGYSVQVAETCHEENPVEIITHVEVTEASESDAKATIPTLESLSERGLHPEEMSADTTYGSGANAVEAERVGIELVSPVGGAQEETSDAEIPQEERPLSAADFDVNPRGERPTVCPGGQSAIEEVEVPDAPHRIEITFDKDKCESCPLHSRCPAIYRKNADAYVLPLDRIKRNLEQRRRDQKSGVFTQRYAIRAGIEATNSELKRRHGLGRPRVRGRPRVALAVYFKTLACNVKRMVRHLMTPDTEIVPNPA